MRTRFAVIFLVGVLAAQTCAGQELAELVAGLGDESYAKRVDARQELVARCSGDLPVVVSALAVARKDADDPQVRFEAKTLLEEIYRRYELGLGASDFGFRLGWFLHHDGTSISSFPLVMEVAPDGAAAKAGINPGDVLVKLNGEPLRGRDSRNELVKKLVDIPAGQEVEFLVRFNTVKDPLATYNKGKNEVRKITPLAPAGREGEEEPVSEEAFADWLEDATAQARRSNPGSGGAK